MRVITMVLYFGSALFLATVGATPPVRTAMLNIKVSRDNYAGHVEPSLAVNPRNPRNLLGTAYLTPAAHDMNKGRIPGTFVSFDGGATWHDNGPLALPRGYSSGSNLSVAFTSQGVGVVVVRVDSGPDHTGIFAWRTTDGGRHFRLPVALADGSDPSLNVDHPWIAAAPPGPSEAGTVYVAWSVTGSRRSDVAFARSLDGGLHFAAPRLVTGRAPQGAVAPVIAAEPGGRVAVVYLDTGASGASAENATSFQHVQVRTVDSTDGGRHFGPPQEIAPAMIGSLSARPLPWFGQATVAADPRDGTLYVGFIRDQAEAAHPTIALVRSGDDGRTWTALGGVTNNPPTGQADELQPQLAAEANGTVAVSYFALAHGRVDLYLAISHDRGTTFGPALRVTDRSWDPAAGLSVGSGQYWLGDYQGLAVGPTAIHPFWNDARSGQLEIYTAAIPIH
jgi:hypothetical protein